MKGAYPYIRAWGRLMHSYQYFVQGQIDRATKDNAPADACFFSQQDNRWIPFSEVEAESTRTLIQKFVDEQKGDE